MNTEIAYIYALIDPDSYDIRYIGKTVNPKSRISGHINESKKYNHHRAKWIRKLLSEQKIPIFKILKICPLSDFIKHESELIKKYQSKILTNSDESGQGNTGRKREIIESSSAKISKNVYQFSINGEFIKEYKSVREAARTLNTTHGNISKCCNGIFKHTGGYIFRYEKTSVDILDNPNAVKKSVIEVDKNKIQIRQWSSVMDCSRETGIDSGNISKVCNGKLKSINGRIFKFTK